MVDIFGSLVDHNNQCIATTAQDVNAYSSTLTGTRFDVHFPGRYVFSTQQCYGIGGTQPSDEAPDVMSLIPIYFGVSFFFPFFPWGGVSFFCVESVTPGKNQSKGGARLYFLYVVRSVATSG